MGILLPEQTTVDDIVFWAAELIGPEKKRITRQQADAIPNYQQAEDTVCGSCSCGGPRPDH